MQVCAIYTDVAAGSMASATRQAEKYRMMLKDFAKDVSQVDKGFLESMDLDSKIGLIAAVENAAGLADEKAPIAAAFDQLENLIKLIREREQGARQLSAMTGETRITAVVLAVLPVSVAGYFMLSNPNYLMTMWHDSVGQRLLFFAFVLQALGCVVLWRMLRSI